MIDAKEKQQFLNELVGTNKTYLPDPGIPIDTKFHVGDMVQIDIVDNKSLWLDANKDMLKLNGKTFKIREVYEGKGLNDSDSILLEGSFYYWGWYHFGLHLNKDIAPFSEKDFGPSKLPSI